MNNKIVCIYHDKCPDGFASAYVFYLYAKQNNMDISFIPANYGDKIPSIEQIENKGVYIVDFSYSPEDTNTIAGMADWVMLLDHHASAVKAFDAWQEADEFIAPNIDAAFSREEDIQRFSGVGLAWEQCFPSLPLPPILSRIQDRDLWLFNEPHTKEICAAMSSYPYDFSMWDTLLNTPECYDLLIDQGKAILRYKDQLVEQICLTAFPIEHDGNTVLTANCPPALASEVGHRLGENFPYAVTFSVKAEGTIYSLRSREEGMDVSTIAKKFGGGGHVHAAGYMVKNLIKGAEEIQ